MNTDTAPAQAGPSVGFTLLEMLITMLIVALIGSALMRLLLVQSDFTNQQEAVRSARAVSQGTLNFLLSELRMV